MPFPVEIVSSHQDLSDWIVVGAAVVQAVGSVAAIVAAVFLARHDRLEGQRLAAQGRVSALAAIMSKAEETIRKPYTALSEEGSEAYARIFGAQYADTLRQLDRCLNILRAVPAYELGNWDLASAVVEMEEALTIGRDALEQVRADNQGLKMYPAYGKPQLGPLERPVNLAAEATARIHQAAHRLSASAKAKGMKITPAYVGKMDTAL